MKRTGTSKRTNKQYTYYCCEHMNSRDESARCDFMTWDVPVENDCPECGQTMFKKSGKGFRRPFCINEACKNFTPEEKRGGWRPKPAEPGAEPPAEEPPAEPAAKKSAAKKSAPAKKPAAKKAASPAKKAPARKPAAKKAPAKKAAE